MSFPESEIESCIIANNYTIGLKIAKEWLLSATEDDVSETEYLRAKEAYTYMKFFSDRHERIHSVKVGRERAKIFTSYLEILKEICEKNNFGFASRIWRCVYQITHTEIAKSLAKDMAGQKSHNLQEDDIFQLAFSLIELQIFKAAEDTLLFLYNIRPRSPLVNLLLAYTSYENQAKEKMEVYLREALFINPDILKEYSRFIPGDHLKKLWQEVGELGFIAEVQCRNFALLTEVNSFYTQKRELSQAELRKIEVNYEKLSSEYNQNSALKELIQPRILHYLTWMIFYFVKYDDYEKADHYQKIMTEWEPEVYSMFKRNHL